MTENSNNDLICILKTGKLLEHDLAANALKEKAIPVYKQVESSSGLRLAMPAQPAMGPGTLYNILVPRPFMVEGINILKELPIDLPTEPDNWHFGPSKKAKAVWKVYIWIVLAFTSITFLYVIIRSFR